MVFEVSIFANQMAIFMSGEIHACGYVAERIHLCLTPVNQLSSTMMFMMMMMMMRHDERSVRVR